MRLKRTILNSVFGFCSRIILILLQFIVRMIFVRYLSNEFLGYDGLFANILGLLSLVDLGIGTALSFSLYTPIYEKNISLLNGIMALYRKVYTIIGVVIFIISICICPFMKYVIKDYTIDIKLIQTAFLIFSGSTVVTYFFSYKRTIIYAYQMNFIVLIVDTVCRVLVGILQIVSIINYQNYILYLIILLCGNFLSNLVISLICNRLNLYDVKSKQKLPIQFKKELSKKVKDLAITNICGAGITSTDNILISSLVGVTELAKNSNYSLIILAIQSLVNNLLGGATASIGDLIAEGNKNKIYHYFNLYSFIYFIIGSFCSLCLFFLLDPFINLWVGGNLIFDVSVKYILIINFYLFMIQQPVWTFQNLAGLYSKYKKVSILQVFINLFFSMLLGYYFGIIGIFFGTTLSYIFGWIFFSKILYINLLQRNKRKYFIKQIRYVLFFLFSFLVMHLFLNLFSFEGLIQLFFNLVSIMFIYCVLVFLFFKNNSYLKYYMNLFFSILRRVNKK